VSWSCVEERRLAGTAGRGWAGGRGATLVATVEETEVDRGAEVDGLLTCWSPSSVVLRSDEISTIVAGRLLRVGIGDESRRNRCRWKVPCNEEMPEGKRKWVELGAGARSDGGDDESLVMLFCSRGGSQAVVRLVETMCAARLLKNDEMMLRSER
jgi:hypothetical protein